MKKAAFLTMLILSLCLFVSNVFASNNPTIQETPTLKVVVDGTQLSLKNTPINYNGRVLLGLRELLIALGVPNDSEHIIWNQENRTVKIIKDGKEIFLAIGNKTVSVNGEEFMLDIEPVIYKDSTYIPARFVAQSLSRFVYWDSATYSVIITKEDVYNKVLSLTSSVQGEKNKPIRITQNEVFLVDGNETYNIKYDVKRDVQKNIEYMDVLEQSGGVTSATEVYEDATNVYTKPGYRTQWLKKPKVNDKEIGSQNELNENANNSLCASLVIKEQDNNHIILEGDSFALVAGYTKDTPLDVVKDKTSKCHVKIELRVTAIDYGIYKYEMKRMETVTTGSIETDDGLKPYRMTRVMEYMLDEDVTVPVPVDLNNTYTIPDGMNEYYNINGGYSLFVPYEWYLPNKEDKTPVIYYENPSDPNKYCAIVITSEYVGYDVPVSEIKPFVIDNIKKSLNNSKIIKTENVILNGYDAIRVNITGQDIETGKSVKQQITFLTCDGQLVVIIYLGDPTTFESKYKEANQIIDSWTKLAFG